MNACQPLFLAPRLSRAFPPGLREKIVIVVEACGRCRGIKTMKMKTEASVDQIQCVRCGTAWSVSNDDTKVVLTVME